MLLLYSTVRRRGPLSTQKLPRVASRGREVETSLQRPFIKGQCPLMTVVAPRSTVEFSDYHQKNNLYLEFLVLAVRQAGDGRSKISFGLSSRASSNFDNCAA